MNKPNDTFILNFTLGGVAATISKTSFAPIERVKLLLQTQAILSARPQYNGLLDCLSKIIRSEGIISLWRGNFSNIIRYFPTQALNFAFNEKINKFLVNYDPAINPYKFFIGGLLAGGTAGLCSLVFIYPLDFIRTRLAVDIYEKSKNDREFRNMRDCFVKIYRSDGVYGLYRGFMVSALTYFFYRSIYFGGYKALKEFYCGENQKNNISFKMIAAFSVTNIAGFLIYPFDTIRRRLMMQSGKKDMLYKGSWDCLNKMWKKEGFMAFYKGGMSNVIRNTGSSLVLVLYDEFQRIFFFKYKNIA